MKQNNKGFTLIEMLVVVAIVGILSATVLTALGPSRNRAKDARIISGVNQARVIAETKYNGTTGAYTGLPADGVIADNDNNGFDATRDEISGNGGELTIRHDANYKNYVFYSKLATNALKFYCVDSSGFGGEVGTAPVANSINCQGATQ